MTRRTRRRALAALAVVVAVALPAGRAVADWLATTAVTATSSADVLGAGAQPAASVAGRTATVTWAATTLTTTGLTATGYTVERLDAADAATTVTCEAPAAVRTCVEHAVPTGSWRYRVTPTYEQWHGDAGPPSAAIVVAAPSFTITTGQDLHHLDAIAGAALAGFDVGESVDLLLDGIGAPLATVVIGSDGTASSIALTVPTTAAAGSHTITASGTYTTAVSPSITVTVDPPTIDVTRSGTSGSGGWYTSAVDVDITVTDDSTTGIASFTHELDGGGPVTVAGTTASVPVTTEGVHTLVITATDNTTATTQRSETVKIDLVDPTLSFTPPDYVNRSTALTVTTSDSASGVSSVRYDACAGASCTPTTELDTVTTGATYDLTWPVGWAEGTHRVIATATDAAGRTTTSATRTVVLDDTDPVPTLSAPAASSTVGGPAVTFTASVTDAPATWSTTAANVVFEWRATGAPSWTTLLDPAGVGTTGTVDLSGEADGTYEVRVVATDKAGNVGTSSAVTITVQNWTATAVASDNVLLGTTGRMQGGDDITVTFGQAVSVSTLCSTWSGNGSSQSVSATLTVADGGAGNDTATLSSGSCTLTVGSFDLGAGGYTSSGATFAATVDWSPGAMTLTITLGILPSGSVTTETTGGALVYTPPSTLRSSAGASITPTAVSSASSGRQF